MATADSIQKALWKAYGMVGKTLGYDSTVYRSAVLDEPISPANIVFESKVAFSLDDKFAKTPGDGLNLWSAWIDGNDGKLFDVKQGDHIRRAKDGVIYFVANLEEHHRITAIKCDHTISVQRVAYADSATGYGASDTEVADSIPCFLMLGGPKGGDLGYIPANSNLEETLQTATIYLWDGASTIQVQDAIVDDLSRRWQVRYIERSDLGTKLIVQEYTAS